MSSVFHQLVEGGRLPLFCFFAAMVIGFGLTRLTVRLIRAGVKWFPGNVETEGGLHIHHAVFGVILLIGGGLLGIVVTSHERLWSAIAAAIFGLGTALVLDEFALILYLDDVYWQTQGRSSIDAIFVAVAVSGLLLVGVRPGVLDDIAMIRAEQSRSVAITLAVTSILNLLAVVFTLLKGKIWTGLFGLFVPLFSILGAIRLARPASPWARWVYRRSTARAERKRRRATWRERRLRAPLIRAKIWLQELIGGSHEPDKNPRDADNPARDRANSDLAEPGRAEPDRAELDRAELDRAELDRGESDRGEPGRRDDGAERSGGGR